MSVLDPRTFLARHATAPVEGAPTALRRHVLLRAMSPSAAQQLAPPHPLRGRVALSPPHPPVTRRRVGVAEGGRGLEVDEVPVRGGFVRGVGGHEGEARPLADVVACTQASGQLLDG